jgi:hypothetical protein
VPDQVFYYFQIIVLEPNQNDFHIENHERHKVRIGFAQEKYPRNPWELWGTFVQGFSLILEVEYRRTAYVKGCGGSSASGHVKILWLRPLSTSSHLRTLTALDCSLLLETFAQGTFKDKLPITHTPGLLVIFTCLSETDFSSVAARGTLKKLYSHQELEEYVWSRLLHFYEGSG